MALEKRFVYYRSLGGFESDLAAGKVDSESVCFVCSDDGGNRIYTHGKWFGDFSALAEELSGYLPLTGGTVTGELSVNGKFEVVNTAAIDEELHVQKLVHAWGDMTVDGSLNIGETTVRASDGHIVLPSGIEIY